MSSGPDTHANTASPGPAARIRIVLVGTQHPGNLGAAARAMKTMGLSRLVLVAPEKKPDAVSVSMSAGAHELLFDAPVFATLAEAVADCRHVMGCTARARRIALPEHAPRAGAHRAVSIAAEGGEVAIVFGRERTGLDNDELQLCHAALHIPADPDFSSLNLAAAVQVLAYELRMALLEHAASAQRDAAPGRAVQVDAATPEPIASHAELEGFFAQLAETLHAIDFHKGRAPDSAMRKLRRLFLRADLDAREVRLLRGILADAQRMAALADCRPGRD
ncbi:MAG: RNA methyltransferase [Pseudomonadota bacterium]|nr:RNA methyltransferase [Pseudomonadota bacterium]